MENNGLKVQNISKHFAHQGQDLPVLDAIGFSAEDGEVIAILGKSGSGKTTLLNIISRLEREDAGSVEYKGAVSYTPQKDLLLPWRTVKSNILLPFEIRHSLSSKVESDAQTFLTKTEISDFQHSYPHELSGGMRQKASLVRSLTQDAHIYLFDEALSAIDFDSRLKLVSEIRSYITSKKKVGVFITHNIEEAISIADKVLVLSERPAKIIHEAAISISESDREPVALRKNPMFQQMFETIWKVMANHD